LTDRPSARYPQLRAKNIADLQVIALRVVYVASDLSAGWLP
jgi:hypothetical protein